MGYLDRAHTSLCRHLFLGSCSITRYHLNGHLFAHLFGTSLDSHKPIQNGHLVWSSDSHCVGVMPRNLFTIHVIVSYTSFQQEKTSHLDRPQ